MDAFENSLTIALASLDDIESNARIREAVETFLAPRASVFYSSAAAIPEDKKRFSELLKHVRSDSGTNYRSLSVSVATVIEYQFKSCMKSFLSGLKGKDGSKISRSVFASNLSLTGRYFRENRDRFKDGIDPELFDQLISGLEPCKSTATKIDFNTTMFVRFFSNCTSKQITSSLTDLGLDTTFSDELGKHQKIKEYFGGGRARTVANQAESLIDDLIERRNRCVHEDGLSESVTFQQLIEDISFARAFCNALSDFFRDNLGKL